jgi:hypothetical protein
MLDVVYLYHHKPATWDELKYSIRSLEKNLKQEFRVILVCEQLPDWIQNVAWIPCKHDGGSRYRDVTRKVELVANTPGIAEHILFMYDDVYLINHLEEIHRLNAHGYYVPLAKNINPVNARWYELLKRTTDWLQGHGYPTHNMETHLPRYLSKRALKMMFSEVPVALKNFQRWTAFGNWFINQVGLDTVPALASTIKAGFYGYQSGNSDSAGTAAEIRKACQGKLVLNHNDQGLTSALKQYLKEQFPKPSKYERR